VAEYRCRPLPRAPQPRRPIVGGPGWWRRPDALVAAVLLVVIGGLVFGGLGRLWHRQQIIACQNNLRAFHQALVRYSDHHDGSFPRVEKDGPRSVAGVFVPILRDDGMLGSDVSVRCPGNGGVVPTDITVADLERAWVAGPESYRPLARRLAGCYAYSLGYRDGEDVRGLRQAGNDRLPILADRPDYGSAAAGNSPNHGGRGQNVLYIGGWVQFCNVRTVGVERDDIYLNHSYQVLAGENRWDTVLGASDSSPWPGCGE
jgi:hypothetical protein